MIQRQEEVHLHTLQQIQIDLEPVVEHLSVDIAKRIGRCGFLKKEPR